MDDRGREIADLLADLVRIESVNPALAPSGSGEAVIAAWVRRWCERQGLEVQAVGDAARPSLIVRSSRRPGAPTLLLCGHLDTVGLGAMVDPLVPRVEEDRMYGRGTYDMKAGLAATLIACRDFAAGADDVEVVLAAVADEEHASAGIQQVLGALGAEFHADAAVVCEPTEMTIGVAHKGFLWSEITVSGVAAHGSRPELGVDAIVKAAAVLCRVEALGRQLSTRTHPLLGPGTVHAGVIEGGQETSTIPERCRLTIERRTLPRESRALIEREIAELLASCSAADPDFRATAVTLLDRPPMETAADGPLVVGLADALQSVRGEAPKIAGMSYWADSAFIAERGIPTVLFGPGGEGAHADVEWVSIRDTVDCAQALVGLARGLTRADRAGREPGLRPAASSTAGPPHLPAPPAAPAV